jgi:hypothetical protein
MRSTLTPADRDVRSPFTRCRDALDPPDDDAARDQETKVISRRRHGLLDEDAMTPELAPLGHLVEAPPNVAAGLAQTHLLAPASEAWLQDDGRTRELEWTARVEMRRLRVRDASTSEQNGGAELVVHSEQRRDRIEDTHPRPLEPEKLEQPRLDAVERRKHIETRDNGIEAPAATSNVRRIDERTIASEAAPRLSQRGIRLVGRTSE